MFKLKVILERLCATTRHSSDLVFIWEHVHYDMSNFGASFLIDAVLF